MPKQGDIVRILTKDKREFNGKIMPSSLVNDKSVIVLKLNNGYNIGIKKENIKKISLVKHEKEISYKALNLKVEKQKGKKSVHIISTGGTIASRVDYKTGGVIPAFSPSDMIQAIPRLKELANLTSKKICNIFSDDITPNHWIEMAKEIEKALNSGSDGVVVMHGTDTMHYSTSMMSFMLKNLTKPVVFVGAQRSTDRGSSDNAMNLLCAVKTAADSDVGEVGICMHGSMNDDYCYFHQGVRARKMHSSRRDTFKTIGAKPYLKISYPNLEIENLRKDFTKRKNEKVTADTKINPNVGIIKIHPYINPRIISAAAKVYDGIILEGTGLGHIPLTKWDSKCRPVFKQVKSAIKSGVIFCMTSQTINGRVNPYVYAPARELMKAGVIYLEDMLSETAMAKLMWVLGHTKDYKKIRNLMTNNLRGEIVETSLA